MKKPRLIRSVIVTVICGVWIIFLLRSRAQIMFETVSGVGLAVVVVASIWWSKINRHPALATGMLCLVTALIFVDTWIRKGMTDYGTFFSGVIFAVLAFLFLAKLRSTVHRRDDISAK
jgi:Na+/proline symporter